MKSTWGMCNSNLICQREGVGRGGEFCRCFQRVELVDWRHDKG